LGNICMGRYHIQGSIRRGTLNILGNICRGMNNILDSRHNCSNCIQGMALYDSIKCSKSKYIHDNNMTLASVKI